MFMPSKGSESSTLMSRLGQMMQGGGKFQPYSVWGALGGQIGALPKVEQTNILQRICRGATPGEMIVKSVGSDVTLEKLFGAFCIYGRDNWTWTDPGLDAGSNAYKLLGGEATAGECGVFAEALRLLAVLPPPLGLGLNVQAEKETYTGRHGEGFVVDERVLVRFGPNAVRCNKNRVINVFKPVNEETTFTLWANHKVLRCDGRLWDPSYGIVYTLATDITAYDIQKTNPAHPYYTGVATDGTRVLFLPAESANARPKYLGPMDEAEVSEINFFNVRHLLIENYF